MRSRRNLLDEIDASTLRLVRSRTRRTSARRVGSCDWACRPARGLPVDALRRNVTASAIVSADRWAPRGSRPLVRRHGVKRRINVGLVTTNARRTRGGLPARAGLLYHPVRGWSTKGRGGRRRCKSGVQRRPHSAHIAVLADRHRPRLRPVGEPVRVRARRDRGDHLAALGVDHRHGSVIAVRGPKLAAVGTEHHFIG
jgi:hypothetical protein